MKKTRRKLNKTDEHIVLDYNDLKTLSEEEKTKLRNMAIIASDVDGVLCTYDVDKKDYRPTKLHEYYGIAKPTDRCKLRVDVLITGRKICYWKTTMNWLNTNNVNYKILIMFPLKTDKNKESFDEYKTTVVNLLELKTYYEDDARTVSVLKEKCPNTNIVYIVEGEEQVNNIENEKSPTHHKLKNEKISLNRTFKKIPITKISPDPSQHRKSINEQKLNDLVQSIRSNGLLQPIEVRPDPNKPNSYIINFGHYRYNACKKIGMESIDCFTMDISEQAVIKVRSFTENIHRTDLTSIEREQAVYDLWNSKYYHTQRELATVLGWNESRISQLLQAHEMRVTEEIPDTISTKTIIQTTSLHPKARKSIFDQIKKGSLVGENVPPLVQDAKKIKDEEVQALFVKSDFPETDKSDFIKAANNEPRAGIECLEYLKRREETYKKGNSGYAKECYGIFMHDDVKYAENTYEKGNIDDIIFSEKNELQNSCEFSEVPQTFYIQIKPSDYEIVQTVLSKFNNIDKAFITMCKLYLKTHPNISKMDSGS